MAGKSLLGKLDRSAFGMLEAPRLPGSVLRPAEPGDVLVIQGVAGISSMGGISASVGKRQGEAGAVARRLARSEEERLAKLAAGIPLAQFVKGKFQ